MIEFDTIIPEEEENTTPGFDPNFHIKDDSMAEWAVRQKLDAEAEKAKWKAYYKDALDKINASCDATIANMTHYLNEYFGKVPHKKTDKQESYRLPSGKLVLKRQECDFERDDEEIIKWLKANNIKIYTAQLQDSEWYYDTDMTGGTAVIMGTEATGLTDVWRKAADAHIKIPMLGRLDSLNVSVSAAILLYEAVRQRNSR